MMVDVFSNSYIFTIGKAPPIDGDACSVTEFFISLNVID